MKVFNFNPSKKNHIAYALKDDGTIYQVEKISKHKRAPTKSKKRLLFIVHQIGYKTPSWKLWSKVRRLIQLHEYVKNYKNKKVQNLLPKTFEPKNDASSDSENDDDI